MRLLITCLMTLSLSIAGLPGLCSIGSAAAAVASAPSPRPAVQARGKKRRPRTQKVKKTDKKPEKKKDDPGFAL